MNNLSAIGNISANAEVKYPEKGDPLLKFDFALNSGFGKNQKTSWLRCTLFGKRAETLAPMLLKGTKIGITGELSLNKWVNKEGLECASLECNVRDITLLGKPTGSTQSQDNKPNDNNFDDSENIPF